MTKLSLDGLTICSNCGVVFNYIFNAEKKYNSWITTCPVCKNEHELPKKK